MYPLFFLVLAASQTAEFLTTSYKGSGLPILPGPLKFVPELLSLVYAVYIVSAGIHQSLKNIPVKYLMIFGAIGVILICGIFANEEAPGPILAGMRYYLRGIPFFFLPAVLNFNDWKLRRCMYFVLGLAFLQVPLSIYQRLHLESLHHSTGDGVMGTLQDSGDLTLFLICVICVLAAAMARGRIGRIRFTVMFAILVIPMSINETKVTLFLFPPALLAALLVASEPGKRLRVFFAALGLFAIGGAIFVPLYNYFNKLNTPTDEQFTVADVFTKKFLSSYLVSNSDVGKAGTGQVGRVDSLVVSFKAVAADPIKFTFGLGIGNVSTSSLGPAFMGKYQAIYGPFAVGFSSGTFLLEVGVLGFVLILLAHLMILQDALSVARLDTGLIGIIAAGWVGTSIVVILGIFYTSVHINEAINYSYWFFSGVVTTRRLALFQEQPRKSMTAPSAKRIRALGSQT